MSEEARAQLKSELSSALAPMQGENGTLQTGWGCVLFRPLPRSGRFGTFDTVSHVVDKVPFRSQRTDE
ncbi:hypothetical protein BCAR13_1560008 [Paraburkholderia caribensis]|nr:hypothetical protein BCAR13_1560008 [Paraburkholderia caribensis]